MTRLLATTITFKILKRFRDGVTQRELQQLYGVRPKQLALCITGRKYMGGSDKITLRGNEKHQEMTANLHPQRSPPPGEMVGIELSFK